jgi:hypothetical protein
VNSPHHPALLTSTHTDLKLLHSLVGCRKVLAEGSGRPSFLLLDGLKNSPQVIGMFLRASTPNLSHISSLRYLSFLSFITSYFLFYVLIKYFSLILFPSFLSFFFCLLFIPLSLLQRSLPSSLVFSLSLCIRCIPLTSMLSSKALSSNAYTTF